ncbi:MAG: hypothetical protein R3B54_10130 [Bdellovibrionota bacterium]
MDEKKDLSKTDELSLHEKMLLGLGKLDATIAEKLKETGIEDFSLLDLKALVDSALKEGEEGTQAWEKLQKISAQLVALQTKEKSPEAEALSQLRDYIAKRLVTHVDKQFASLKNLPSDSPAFQRARDQWERAQALNREAFLRNGEVAQFFHGRSASGKSTAWEAAKSGEQKTVAKPGEKKYTIRPIQLTTASGRKEEFEAFQDTASGALFAVRKSDGGVAAYMNGGKGAKLDILHQISGNAALPFTGKTEEGSLAFSGYQEDVQDGEKRSTRQVAGTYYRVLPKDKKSDDSPSPNGYTAEVGKVYSANDGTHKDYHPDLYVPASLAYERKDPSETEIEQVRVGMHQKDAVLAQAEKAAGVLTAEGGIPKSLKDKLPNLGVLEIDGRKYLGINESGLVKMFMGLDENNEPIFYCATCQPGISERTTNFIQRPRIHQEEPCRY